LLQSNTAYLEVADLCGLQHLNADERDPWKASSYGVGQAIRMTVEDHAASKLVIGAGGSSFSDAGLGCLQALDIF
jgi:glycerate 2-kinase